MARFNIQLTLIISSFLSLIQIGSCLKCYSCAEVTNKDCRDPTEHTIPTIECANPQVCMKHEKPAIALKVNKDNKKDISATIDRGCKPKDYCKEVKNFSKYCSICSTDLCNDVAYLKPSIVPIVFVVVKNFM